MRRRTCLAALLTLVACDDRPAPAPKASATAATPTRATITIDGRHDLMSHKAADAYSIAPCSELVLELGDVRVGTRDGGPVTLDAVHVVHGAAGYYRASFSGKTVALNVSSLDAVKGGPFAGFEAGESYVVAVGYEAARAADGAMRFTPAWTAKVDVARR